MGPGGALKTVFLKLGYYFEMDGPRGLKFFLNSRESKNIRHVSWRFPKFGPGAGWTWKTVSNMPITLELKFFLKIEREKILDTCLRVIQTLDQGPGGAFEIVFFLIWL